MIGFTEKYRDTTSVLGVIGALVHFRSLLFELSLREIKDRYLGYALGGLWAVLSPLLLCALYAYLFIVVYPTRTGTEFDGIRSVVWLLSGIVVWFFLADVMGRAVSVISGASSFVKQIIFPIEILPAQVVITGMPSLVIGILVTLALAAWSAPATLPGMALLLPLALVLVLVVVLGLAYLIAAFAPFVRDMREIVQFLSAAGMFLAPVLFMPSLVEQLDPILKTIIAYNPFTHLIACIRDALFFGRITSPLSWGVATGFAAAMLTIGAGVYQQLKSLFSEAI